MGDLRIKLVSKNPISAFQLFDLPQHNKNVRFVLEGDDYDWLVVWDDLPPSKGERLSNSIVRGQCSQSRTALMTYEPSSVKHYGKDYVKQFGLVLTSHEPQRLPHKSRRDFPPVGWWYYGGLPEAMAHPTPPQKSHNVSLFHSDKRQTHTLHAKRFDFLQSMLEGVEGVSGFGRGLRPVHHKAEGIDDFRYHIAVENHISPHHWTEKLSDCFLGYSLAFY
ncbi:MAG: hypothetical protein HAW65_02295, partial [Alphaproteobacteria bacterium]|nr:hypothetical protein [Alphaproteobacteria bacterium]